MAYLELKMWDILEVLKLVFEGKSIRAIARITGRGRRTVAKYIANAEELGWVKEIHKPDEILAAEVLSGLQPGPSEEQITDTQAILKFHHDKIEKWLNVGDKKKGIRLTKVHRRLRQRGVNVSYSALHRYAVKNLDFGKQTKTVRLDEVEPGEVAQVDFGKMGLLFDPEEGRRRTVHALLVTLISSRHQYVHLSYTQKLRDFITGIEDAFEFFEGVPKRVILDNLKAAVTKANRYDPTFNWTFSEYAEHRGFTIDSTDTASPKQKPHVERQVPYVRQDFFRGEHFIDLEHAQREAVKWCLDTAGLRNHGTTKKHPYVEFLTVEQPTLNPLVKERFDPPEWATPKVHPDCHIRFMQALYSVNYKFRGQKTDVRGDSKIVRVYIKGVLVKTHPKLPPGGRSTDHEDYPKEKSSYTMRDANRIKYIATQKGEHIGNFAEQLFRGDYPWSKLRSSMKLLRLCDKYGDATVDAACKRSLSFDLINVTRLERIITRALEKQKREKQAGVDNAPSVIQMPLKFMRDKSSFNHKTGKENENNGTE